MSEKWLSDLQRAYPGSFDGAHPESAENLVRYETRLGFPLPEALKLLLQRVGYCDACGVDNLSESIDATESCRATASLPPRYLILNDWGDAGVVLVDLPTGTVAWVSPERTHALPDGGFPEWTDADVYPDYPSWVRSRLDEAS